MGQDEIEHQMRGPPTPVPSQFAPFLANLYGVLVCGMLVGETDSARSRVEAVDGMRTVLTLKVFASCVAN